MSVYDKVQRVVRGFLTFRTIRKDVTPRWLTDGEGGLVGYALDLVKDAFMERASQGLQIRFPQGPDNTTAPPDALIQMGRDRRVIRAISETDAEYAIRLGQWLSSRRAAGNPYTLMRQLHAYVGTAHGVSFRTVDARGNWYSRSASGVETAVLDQANWDWDGDTSGIRWGRFWVIIYPGTLWDDTGNEWGDVGCQDWGELGRTWGTTATPEQVDTVRAIVNDWKPAGTKCVNIIIAFDSGSFAPGSPEPDGLWARWSKTVNGVRVASRLSTARYWDGA